jgi:hypothetical protein
MNQTIQEKKSNIEKNLSEKDDKEKKISYLRR